MSLSRVLAELMNGELGFTSEPGEGSDFWIELPEAAPRLRITKPGVHPALTGS